MPYKQITLWNWLGAFICLLMTVGKLAGEDREDYRFRLMEWLEEVEEGHSVSRLADHRNIPLLRGQTANLGPGSRMELSGSHGEVVRLGQNTVFTLLHDRQVRLSRGALLLYLPPSDMPFRIRGHATDFHLSQSGAVVLEVVSNGGMKLVSLSGNLTLHAGEQHLALQPGRLYFLPPGHPRIGRNLLIDLSLFLRTSALTQVFPGQLPVDREIRKAAFMQAVSISKRSSLLVGDATSEDQFDLLLIGK